MQARTCFAATCQHEVLCGHARQPPPERLSHARALACREAADTADAEPAPLPEASPPMEPPAQPPSPAAPSPAASPRAAPAGTPEPRRTGASSQGLQAGGQGGGQGAPAAGQAGPAGQQPWRPAQGGARKQGSGGGGRGAQAPPAARVQVHPLVCISMQAPLHDAGHWLLPVLFGVPRIRRCASQRLAQPDYAGAAT